MTAEQKVKKIYPDAYHVYDSFFGLQWSEIELIHHGIFFKTLGCGSSEAFAWESAAENIPDLVK